MCFFDSRAFRPRASSASSPSRSWLMFVTNPFRLSQMKLKCKETKWNSVNVNMVLTISMKCIVIIITILISRVQMWTSWSFDQQIEKNYSKRGGFRLFPQFWKCKAKMRLHRQIVSSWIYRKFSLLRSVNFLWK